MVSPFLTMRSLRFGMNQVYPLGRSISRPVDFKRHHYPSWPLVDENLAIRHTGKSVSAVCGGQSCAPRPNGSSSQQLKTSNSGWVQHQHCCLGSRGGRRGKNG
jgi:hypothetical protein